MNTILVPTDFSDASRNATNYAAALAKQLGARIILFHAYMLPVPVAEIPFVMVTADELQKSSEDSIKKEAERIFKETQVEVEWLVRLGIPYDEIKDIASERDVELLVMGMKGTGGLDKLLGSTTRAVIRKFKIPVFIIPENATFTSLAHVTYATDFDSDMKLACFESFLTIARKFNSHLQIVHINKHGRQMTAAENAGKSRLEAIWGNLPHTYHFVEHEKAEEGIRQFIKENPSDMLVLVAHRHNLLDRLFNPHVTFDFSSKSPIPVMILEDKD